ncbi:hypothetical protein GPX89_08760 [Nocardia sp. ET3-3]|uniref:DUF6630 domain-containing protein n=1 Tax=Nocardia terrae TaxID=2675851 RepID=A0A7K1USK8_9NOCA|nr:hypothetical protein [Nocardia terrae]MVU77336.1 hypothetical protein [Nocardia terrae]
MIIGEEQRAALAGIVELLAPDLDSARERLEQLLEDAGEEDYFTPEEMLIDSLYGFDEDGEPFRSGLTYCDWKSYPDEIRDWLQDLPAYPQGLAWDWWDWSTVRDWDSSDLQDFLWPLADRCLELGVSLIGIYVDGDGYTLGFLKNDKVERFLELAALAEAQVRIYRSGSPMP